MLGRRDQFHHLDQHSTKRLPKTASNTGIHLDSNRNFVFREIHHVGIVQVLSTNQFLKQVLIPSTVVGGYFKSFLYGNPKNKILIPLTAVSGYFRSTLFIHTFAHDSNK